MSFIIENPTKSVLNSHSECNSFLYTIGMTFGKWLIEKRLDAKLTQVQLAERAGISPNYVSALERDEPNARDGSPRRPRVEKVDRIAKALGVPLSDAHLRPIVILAADTAMRAGEITGILWSDVSLETGTINIRKEISKTGKARKVGMTPRVKQELASIEPKRGRVFPYGSVWKSFTTACKRAGSYLHSRLYAGFIKHFILSFRYDPRAMLARFIR